MVVMPNLIRRKMLLAVSAKPAGNWKKLMKEHYSVIIQWSDEDQVYVVTLPEWGGCHTHGKTYEEAAKNAHEVLQMLIETEEHDGRELPPAHRFMFPGPSGFTYELNQMLAPITSPSPIQKKPTRPKLRGQVKAFRRTTA
jgi:antitoxin HicB